MLIPPVVIDRVMAKVEPMRSERGCLISRYSLGSHGYPQVGWLDKDLGRERGTLCHRAAWTGAHGPIPDEMTVDHRCKVKRCVEPSHLRLLPNLENARRTGGRDWPIGQCAHGHDHERFWHKPSSGGKGYCNECRRLLQIKRRTGWRRENA